MKIYKFCFSCTHWLYGNWLPRSFAAMIQLQLADSIECRVSDETIWPWPSAVILAPQVRLKIALNPLADTKASVLIVTSNLFPVETCVVGFSILPQ